MARADPGIVQSIPGGSFQNLSETVQSVAPDILDLYGDLMPKAHAAQIDHVPALALQFSNDCSQIADVVESMAQTCNWNPTESVARLRELSDIAYEKQMVSYQVCLCDSGSRCQPLTS